MKKEAKRSAIEVAADEEGKGETDLRFKILLTVCQRRRELSDDEETSLEKYCFLESHKIHTVSWYVFDFLH